MLRELLGFLRRTETICTTVTRQIRKLVLKRGEETILLLLHLHTELLPLRNHHRMLFLLLLNALFVFLHLLEHLLVIVDLNIF